MSKRVGSLFGILCLLGLVTFLGGLRPSELAPFLELQTTQKDGRDEQKDEYFDFRKSIHLTFDFSPEVITEDFEGKLFLKWSGDEAYAFLEMDGKRPEVAVKAKFSKAHELLCFSMPLNLSDEENDYALLLKNLLLDYAFRTVSDDNGAFDARFTRKEVARGDWIEKVKVGYLSNKREAILVEKSFHEILLEGGLKFARGDEELRLVMEGGKLAFVRSGYSLTSTSGPVPLPPSKRLEFGVCNQDLAPMVVEERSMTPEELKLTLTEIEGLKRGERQAPMRKALRTLRKDSGLLSDFVAWAMAMRDDRGLSALALGVLANLGTPKAQKALVDIFDASSDFPVVRQQVMNAFTLMNSPLSSPARDFLREKLQGSDPEAFEGAAYALGSSIHNAGESKESDEDFELLLQNLESAESSRRKQVYLDALGNSGRQEALAVALRYTTSEDKLLQSKAELVAKNLELRSASR